MAVVSPPEQTKKSHIGERRIKIKTQNKIEIENYSFIVSPIKLNYSLCNSFYLHKFF
jgi:hypothetical protein